MPTKFFTADLHFGHHNIIEYAHRPFRDVSHMNRTLIRNINDAADQNDDLYVIGDFSLQSASHRAAYEDWLNAIKPRVHLVIGNHDCMLRPLFLSGDCGVGFHSIHYPYLAVEEFILIHDPSASIVLPTRIFLTGHVHQMWKHCKNCINVGVDVWDYKPVSIDQVREYVTSVTFAKMDMN